MFSPAVRKHLAREILGPDYELSFSFISSEESQRLNREYRGKDKPTNVLSFPLDRQAGEILIDKKLALAQARELRRKPEEYLAYLFIHGALHLKGFSHGSRMEAEEQRLLDVLVTLYATHHRSRSRHRKLSH